jgi:hypothetical protein
MHLRMPIIGVRRLQVGRPRQVLRLVVAPPLGQRPQRQRPGPPSRYLGSPLLQGSLKPLGEIKRKSINNTRR